jgi:hypothetical protein
MSPAQRDRHECTFMRRTRAVNGNGRGRSEVRRDASTVAYLPIRRIDGNGFDRYPQVAPLPLSGSASHIHERSGVVDWQRPLVSSLHGFRQPSSKSELHRLHHPIVDHFNRAIDDGIRLIKMSGWGKLLTA